ncbi:MAG: response regulator [Oceanospirillaceae bacterium]|nr:response regulator [Oceanospirillaceae bacterium]
MAERYSILIAEDDPKIAEIQRRFIERLERFEVVGISHTTRDASDMVDVLQPDLVLLDIHFPDGNGLQLLRQLRSSESPCDVIMVTAAKETDSLSEALRLGVFDYVLKPLVFDRLQQSLLQYLEHRSAMYSSGPELSQDLVDQLLPRKRQSDSSTKNNQTALPKGIDPLTLEKVKAVFADPNLSLSAEQVGENIGSSRTTARRYLEFLVGEQLLNADINYGTVGRPERFYHQRSK